MQKKQHSHLEGTAGYMGVLFVMNILVDLKRQD